MAAITWRNVSGGGSNDALRSLMAAGQGISGAFNDLRGVVRDAEVADKQRMDKVRADNTSQFLDTLYANYASPEALAAAQQSGEINRLRQGFGKDIDSNAVRGAADTRLAALRQQGLAGMQYNNQVTDDRDQAAMSRAQAAAYSSDPKVREAGQAELVNISDRNKGKAAQGFFQAERDLFGFGVEKNKEQRAGQEHLWKGESHKLDLRKGEAQINASNASAAASRASAAYTGARTALAGLELKDAQAARQFQGIIQEDIRQHHLKTSADTSAINAAAKSVPGMAVLDKKGNVDLSKMNPGQINAFEGYLNGQNLSLKTITGQDTDAQQATVDKLYKMGAPISVIDKVKQGSDWYNTSAPTPIGREAALQAQKERKQAVVDQQMVDAVGGIPLKTENFSEGMKLIGPSIPKAGGDDMKKGIADYFAKGGVEVGGTKHFLPANVIAQIVQGQNESSWYKWGNTRSNTFDALKAAEKDFQDKLRGIADSDTDRMVKRAMSPPSDASTKKKKQ